MEINIKALFWGALLLGFGVGGIVTALVLLAVL